MTGPQHYKLAEQLLEQADHADLGGAEERFLLDAAAVHAQLAHTAAVLEQGAVGRDWIEVTGRVGWKPEPLL